MLQRSNIPSPEDGRIYVEKLQTALRLLRSASDRWALRGFNALEVNQVLSIVVGILLSPKYAFHYRYNSNPLTPFHRSLSGSALLDCMLLRLTGTEIGTCAAPIAEELREVLEFAARSWSRNGAETPPTQQVVRQLAKILCRRGLVPRPPPFRLFYVQ
jgi:hypothetical protein